jgi:hypothetical protein
LIASSAITARPAAQIRGLDRLVGDHGKTGAAFDLVQQGCDIAADIGVEPGFLDQCRGHRGVAAGRRENDGTLGGRAGFHRDSSSSRGLLSPM